MERKKDMLLQETALTSVPNLGGRPSAGRPVSRSRSDRRAATFSYLIQLAPSLEPKKVCPWPVPSGFFFAPGTWLSPQRSQPHLFFFHLFRAFLRARVSLRSIRSHGLGALRRRGNPEARSEAWPCGARFFFFFGGGVQERPMRVF